MEEAQAKLKALIMEAQKQKIDLTKVPAIRKREKLLQVNKKVKFLIFLAVVSLIYRQTHQLFGDKKVKVFIAFETKSSTKSFHLLSVFDLNAEEFR